MLLYWRILSPSLGNHSADLVDLGAVSEFDVLKLFFLFFGFFFDDV